MSAIFEDIRKRMDGALHSLKHSLNGLRTGRASAALLEPIKVEAYGSFMPITQIGSINVPEPKLIVVQVWDASLTQATEKAIMNSGLGLNIHEKEKSTIAQAGYSSLLRSFTFGKTTHP